MTDDKKPSTGFVRKNIRLPPECYRAGDGFLITLCSENKLPILVEEPVRPVLLKLLQDQAAAKNGPVHAFVVMPDHLHILFASEKDMVQWVAWFKARVTFFAKKAGMKQQIWQKSFHDHGVRLPDKVEEIIKYMRENPVKAGFVEREEDWPWMEGC